jgi:porphobilinogen deaminase
MDDKKLIRVGTRGSRLAQKQADMVIDALTQKFPELTIEKNILTTKGDKIIDKPLTDFGGKGAFVTEFENALLENKIDIAVHSAKDMPMELADELEIAGALPRDDVRDVLVTLKSSNINFENKRLSESLGFDHSNLYAEDEASEQPVKYKIGTGSLRRQFQLERILPELEFAPIRGNVPTRIEKLRNGEYDGIILAAAGLKRLGLLEEPDLNYEFFYEDEIVPAGGQGIIAIECRKNDFAGELVKGISDEKTMTELELERYVLKFLDAGCHEAIGVLVTALEEKVHIRLKRKCSYCIFSGESEAKYINRFSAAATLAERAKR